MHRLLNKIVTLSQPTLICLFVFSSIAAYGRNFLRIDYYVWARQADTGIKTRPIQDLDILIYFDFNKFVPDSSGHLSLSADALDHLNQLKEVMKPETQLWLGVSSLNNLIGNPSNIDNFASSVKRLTTAHGFQGVDIDWEGDWDQLATADYIEVVSAVSDQLRSPSFRLTTSHASAQHYVEKAAGIKDKVDWINVQLYWSSNNAWSLPALASRLQAFHDRNIPADKLAIGLPIYGMQDMATYTNGPKSIGYAKMLEEGASPTDTIWKRPSSGNTFYYSGVPLIKEKTKFGLENGYRGVFTWELTLDSDYSHDSSIASAISATIDVQVPVSLNKDTSIR